MLTSEIVARYSGQSFPDFVSARIFTPVGMSSTTYLSSAGEIVGTAVHSFTKEGRRIPTWLTDADVALAGAGGVVSSTRDLSRWLTFLLGHGDKDTKKAIPVDVVQEVMSPQSLLRGAEARRILPMNGTLTYGLGWFQWVYQGHRVSLPVGSRNRVSLSPRVCTIREA
jgi:CubicO group peptidase (beta-lactamase class C family)